MLEVLEYHLITQEDASPDTCEVKVEFDAAGGWVPAKFIRHDVLARLKAELAAGSLRFLSFDEHPRRVLAIEGARAAVIRVRQIADADASRSRMSGSQSGSRTFVQHRRFLWRTAAGTPCGRWMGSGSAHCHPSGAATGCAWPITVTRWRA